MRIVIDGRMYSESGIGRYIRNLIDGLQNIDSKNEYIILLLQKEFEKLQFRNNFNKYSADFRWYSVTEQIKLPIILDNLNPDLVHFPHFNVPVFYKGKFIVTIHDLIHQHFQMRRATTHDPLTYKIKQFGYNKVFENSIKNAVKILVPSEYVKKLLIKDWNILEDKIIITPEAVEDKFIKASGQISRLDIQKVLEKFRIDTPYIFYIGNAHPHKNVEGLIKVFLKIKEKNLNLSLVLSGNDHYFWQRLKREFTDKNIIYTGYVSDEELESLYKGASIFVLPSFEEGFGIPILEAMASSCPVVSSNAGSLPEVGGDAALYFNPKDLIDMEDKILLGLQDEKLRKSLIEKGKKRVKLFSWKRLAKKTLEEYLKCA